MHSFEFDSYLRIVFITITQTKRAICSFFSLDSDKKNLIRQPGKKGNNSREDDLCIGNVD